MFYVFIKILFPYLIVLRLEDSNMSGMETVYCYLRMTKQCIDKKKSYTDYKILFPDISPPANIWNDSDDESDEEESILNYCTLYSDSICFSYLACGLNGINISILIIL